MNRELFIVFCFASFLISYSQTQDIEIISVENACQGESIRLEQNADPFDFDLCSGDLSSGFTLSTYDIGGVSDFTYGYDLVFDGSNWYGFVTDRVNSEITRINFGSSPLNTPVDVTNLGNPNGLLIDPEGIDFAFSGSNWYGFVAYEDNSGQFVRLDFLGSLENDEPDGVGLGDLGLGRRFREVRLQKEDEDYFLLTLNYNLGDFYIVDLNSDPENSLTDFSNTEVTGTNTPRPRGIDLIKKGSDWHLFVVDQTNHSLLHYVIGSDLNSTPSLAYVYSPASMVNPFQVDVVYDGGEYFAVVSYENAQPTILNLGDLSGGAVEVNSDGLPNWIGFKVTKWDGKVVIQGVVGGQLQTAIYDNDCGGSFVNDSTVSWSSDGEKIVDFHSINEFQQLSFSSDTIQIALDQAPSAEFTTTNSRCISSPNTFTPSESGLSSYSWDFGDGTPVSTDINPSHSYASVGAYTVRLDVNDGTCDNFYEEEITIYPDPPVPAFTVAATECVNTDISFTNDTDESQHTGIISYKWDFDNDGIIDSTDPNPTFAYTTSGTKTVVLYDTIPGCSNASSTFDIEILAGPTAGFTPSTLSACEGEVISFTDASSVDSENYTWDFQNGFTSNVADPPAQLFENSGSYFVSLTTADAQGCEDTFIQEISISSSPQISFDFDIPCTSPDGIQFFDLTTVDGADIVSWSWEVDGEEVSTVKNPTINFNTTGIKTIGLTTQSSNGCEQFLTEDIEVLPAPTPDFSIDLGCQGSQSTFTDETVSTGNSIVSWLWTLDGVNYGTQDIDHVFEDPGSYEVMLEVTGQNFCSETVTKTVEVIELPQVDFSVNGECNNQVIQASDQSTSSENPIISRRWMLDGVNVGSGAQLLLNDLDNNTYELELELETESGCLVSEAQTLEINNAPSSAFISSRTYGIPNDRLTFTNSSTGGVSYQWLLEGAVRSTNPDSESITFPNAGIYNVSLVSQNSLGCYDTASQSILIATPEIDLAIGDFQLTNENGTGRIFVEVQNFSNLPVEVTEAEVILEGQFRVTEQILQFIDIGGSSLVGLNVGIPLSVSEPAYFCINLTSQYADLEYDDINPVNNEKCLTIKPDIQVENPFPNPVTDQFRLKVVTPEGGTANLRLMNATGEVQREQQYQTEAGLNNFFINMGTLSPGIYFVTIDVLGSTYKRKVIKL